jgi:hypothetical protein
MRSSHPPIDRFVATFALVFAVGSATAFAQGPTVSLIDVTIPAHTVACLKFSLQDDDDALAAIEIEKARQTWLLTSHAAKVAKAGFLFVLDQDKSREPDSYPIVLSLCGTVDPTPEAITALTMVNLPGTRGKLAYCPSTNVEECMRVVEKQAIATGKGLPEFPRYSMWTRPAPPANDIEAIEGLLAPVLPLTAQLEGEVKPQLADDAAPALRPLVTATPSASCGPAAGQCATVSNDPGKPVAVVIFIPDVSPVPADSGKK